MKMKKWRIPVVLMVALLVGIAGCTTSGIYIPEETYEKAEIKEGMTREEVYEKLGKPSTITDISGGKIQETWAGTNIGYIHRIPVVKYMAPTKKSSVINLIFVEGKVTQIFPVHKDID